MRIASTQNAGKKGIGKILLTPKPVISLEIVSPAGGASNARNETR
jgi:hypothetical protein